MARNPKLPDHLRPATAKWARKIMADFDLETHNFLQLIKTCEAFDRCEEARELVAKEGLTVIDRYGTPKAHPAVAIERDARLAVLRGLRELGLDAETPEPPRMARTRDYGRRA